MTKLIITLKCMGQNSIFAKILNQQNAMDWKFSSLKELSLQNFQDILTNVQKSLSPLSNQSGGY